jgi:hypothetical protein
VWGQSLVKQPLLPNPEDFGWTKASNRWMAKWLKEASVAKTPARFPRPQYGCLTIFGQKYMSQKNCLAYLG